MSLAELTLPRGALREPEPRRAGTGPAIDVLAAAAWLALLTGLVEGSFWWLRQWCTGGMVFLAPGYVWMAPVAQLVLFALPAAALAALAQRQRIALHSGVALLSLVGWLNLLLLVPGLHIGAWLLAAGGLAVATGRIARRWSPAAWRRIRLAVALPFAVVLLLAAAQTGDARRQLRQQAELPPVPAGAPNVLLIVLDTLRADTLWPADGSPTMMPHLAALAQQGVSFRQAWSTAPWTLPSQAGMFTGRMPLELSGDWLTRLDDTYPTLAEVLRDHGWRTGGFVGNTRYCSAETGLARGFLHYEDYRFTPAEFAFCTALGRRVLVSDLPVWLGWNDWPGRKRADEVSGGFLRWLDTAPPRPFFAVLNYWDAHDPYVAPPRFASTAPRSWRQKRLLRQWWWIDKTDLTTDEVNLLRTAYNDCVRALDEHLAELFKELKRRGALDNTLLVITADHGEHFGDHGLFLHGNSLYEPLLHVPLVVVWPNRLPSGVQVHRPVSLAGLPNTLLHLLDLPSAMPGKSWAEHWQGSPPDEVLVAQIASQALCPPCHGRSPVAAGAMVALRRGSMKYILSGDGTEWLFDLADDPGEQRNLADAPQGRRWLPFFRRERQRHDPMR